MHLSISPNTTVNEKDLESLVESRVPEGKLIDYKSALPSRSDGDKKDFLADLCSFANAAGGHIVFGIRESNGLPTELAGIEGDFDAVILRLEAIARDGIRPSIRGLYFRPVPLSNGRNALIVQIPKSWMPPHQVIFQKDYRFYTRGSAGKQHLTVDEIRHIVLENNTLSEKVRDERITLVSSIISNDHPLPITVGAKLILQMIPLSSLTFGENIDLDKVAADPGSLIIITGSGGRHRFNIDGLCAYSVNDRGVDDYVQLYRSGKIEVVTKLYSTGDQTQPLLPSLDWEEDLQRQITKSLQLLSRLDIVSPVVIAVSLIGIKGWKMGVNRESLFIRTATGFDRDPLFIPELLIGSPQVENVARTIRPIVDTTWNAGGYQKSYYYGEDGAWIGR